MLRAPFERQQRHLGDRLLVLGSRVEEALRYAVANIQPPDSGFAPQPPLNFQLLHRQALALEAETMALLSTQQPMAGDLRHLAAILQITLELDRISDHTRDVSRLGSRIGAHTLPEVKPRLLQLVAMAAAMIHQAMEAFAIKKLHLAQTVAGQDDAVDHLYNETIQHLLAAIKRHPDIAGEAMHLSLIAHYLERAADRATNICEWVVYAQTGEMVETDPP